MMLSIEAYTGVARRAELLVSEAGMQAIFARLASEITATLAGKDPLVLCIMTGGVVAVGQLLPRLDFPLRLEYLHATRYREETRGGGIVWHHRPTERIGGEHILVVDDILDEGITLDTVVSACREDGALSVHSAVLVEKEKDRPVDVQADFVGVRLPNRYLYGCGLDYKGYYRNAPGIYAIADEDV